MAKALVVEILGNATQFGHELDKAAGRTRSFGAVAGVAGAAIVGGLAYGLEKSVVAATHFQSSMELVHTQAGLSQNAVDKLGHSVLGLAGTVGTAPDELSAGLYHLASQGLKAGQAMNALKIAAEGAKIGQANLEDVTNALGGVIVSGIKGAGDYAHAMGVLNATVGAGDMRMQDLADAMGTGLPAAAATAHVSLTQVSGALATLGDNNIRGAKAGTLLISTLRVLGHQSSAGTAALKDLGVSSDLLQKKLAHGGLTTALTYLRDRIRESGKSSQVTSGDLTEAFGGKQATGIKILLQELDRLNGKVKDVGAGGNRFGHDWQAYSHTAQAATDRFKASLQAIQIELGSALLPVLASVTATLAKFTGFLAQHAVIAKVATAAIAAFGLSLLAASVYIRATTTGTALYLVVTKAGAIATKAFAAAQWLLNVALDANPIGLIVIALAALGAALVIAWERSATFRKIVTGAWNEIKAVTVSVFNTVKNTIQSVFNAIRNVFDSAENFLKAHWRLFLVGLLTIATGGMAAIVAVVASHWGQIKGSTVAAWNAVKGAVSAAWNGIKSAVTSGLNAVLALMKSLPGRIVAAVGDLSHLLYHAGASILQGLIDGVKSMFGKMDSVFHSITSHIPHVKGPPEKDSVLLTDNGRRVMQGFIDGINQELPALDSTLRGVAPRVVQTVGAPSAAPVAHGRAGGGDIHVHVHAQTVVGGNMQKVAQDLAPSIRDALVRIGRREPNVLAGYA